VLLLVGPLAAAATARADAVDELLAQPVSPRRDRPQTRWQELGELFSTYFFSAGHSAEASRSSSV
jgi:hypothetical protein